MTATDLPASLSSTLPDQYYTDPAVVPLEQTRVFETVWSCAVRRPHATSAPSATG